MMNMAGKQIVRQVKKSIRDFEYRQNGFHALSGTDVVVSNVRIRKEKVIADIRLVTDAETGTSENYKDCEYSRELLGV